MRRARCSKRCTATVPCCHADYRDDGIALEVIIHPEQWTRFEPFVIAGEEG